MRGRGNGFWDDIERQCWGKKRFPSKARAKLHLRRSRGFADRGNVKAYQCPHCSGWHLGHKAGTNRPAEPG